MYFISKWPVLFPMFGPICRCRVISVMTKTFFPTSLSTYFIGKLAVRFYFLMGSMIRYLYKFADLASFLCSMTCRELLLRRNYYAFPDFFLNIFSQQFQPNFYAQTCCCLQELRHQTTCICRNYKSNFIPCK